jgi:dienelactone hydrolase
MARWLEAALLISGERKMRFDLAIPALLLGVFLTASVFAEIKTETVIYQDGDVTLEGFVAYDSDMVAGVAGAAEADSDAAKVPGVLVVHQWMGLTDYEKRRCRELAALGYVAFALDIYGQGIRPDNQADAGKQATIYKKDRLLYRRRLNLGLEQLKARPHVSGDSCGAIGYCFGGTGVLELCRSGADVEGVVSFHGGLDSPTPKDGNNIKAEILVCHGADDPFVPAKDIAAFKKELEDADVKYEMIVYPGAVHSFTQPMAGNDNSKGAAYNEDADKKSFAAMKQFFKRVINE